MRICNGCRKPLNQCECTSEMKTAWIKEMSDKLDRREGELKNWEKVLRDAEKQKKQLQYELENVDYQNNSYEIEENLWKAVMILEQKGYHLKKAAWSNLQHSWYYDIQIEFEQNYCFDFSSFPSKKGWSYDREWKRIQFLLSRVPVKYREKRQMTAEQYLECQQEALVQWAELLPKARVLDPEEKIMGITKDGSFRQKK